MIKVKRALSNRTRIAIIRYVSPHFPSKALISLS